MNSARVTQLYMQPLHEIIRKRDNARSSSRSWRTADPQPDS